MFTNLRLNSKTQKFYKRNLKRNLLKILARNQSKIKSLKMNYFRILNNRSIKLLKSGFKGFLLNLNQSLKIKDIKEKRVLIQKRMIFMRFKLIISKKREIEDFLRRKYLRLRKKVFYALINYNKMMMNAKIF